MKKYLPAHLDRACSCCNRRESKIDHARVGRKGLEMAKRMRDLMSWVATA